MSNAAEIAAALAAPGTNAIPHTDTANPDRPITLHTYRPESYRIGNPVVLVQHGMQRNGDEYRDFWIPAADKHGLLIVAPTFSNEAYPKAESYNNGLIRKEDGSIAPRERWVYGGITRIWALLRDSGVTNRAKAHLFGHSAGGQFVHRLLSVERHDAYEAAMAGNPGWYSLPTLDLPFPEGLGDLGLTEDHLRRLLAFPLTILAGEQDKKTDDPNLPKNEEALRQGPHRFARAHNYFAFGKAAAERLGASFAWRLQPVPLIGHDGRAMSAIAASLWFESGLPSRAEIEKLAGRQAA